jgi:hypothetical protein
MKDLLEQGAFSVGSRAYTWRDVVAAAVLRGDWSVLEQQTRLGLALVQQAEEQDARPSEEQIEAAGQEFRYERELITAEEMEAWLGRFGITVDDWMDYVERSLLRQANQDSETEAEPDEPDEDELAQSVIAEAACSGTLTEFAQRLAGRAAMAARAAAEKLDDAGEIDPEDLDAVRREVAAAFERLGLPPPDGEAVAELSRLERTFEAYSSRLITPAAVRAQIEAHRLDWIRLDIFSLTFQNESAAREAWLCLEEDGTSLAQVAASAHIPVQEAHLYLGDVDAGARSGLMSARPGEIVGPLALGDRFHLFLLRDKSAPTEDDPEVRRRAEEALQGRLLEQELAARVHWQERM